MTSTEIDPIFPQISKILNTDYMMAVLQKTLFNNSNATSQPRIEQCSIVEKRHKPAKHFHVVYQIILRDINNTTHEQLLTAHLSSIEQNIPPLLPIAQLSQTIKLPPISYISELAMTLWVFPYDRKLQHLAKLIALTQSKDYFSLPEFALELSENEQISAVTSKIMHYLPERSCMIRYILRISNNVQGKHKDITLYGKNYCNDSGFKTYRVMSDIASQMTQCIKPLHYDANTNTLWQHHMPGETFRWQLSILSITGLIAKIAQCIATFHRCQLDIQHSYGFSDIEKQLTATCKIANATHAELGATVTNAVQRILFNYQQIDWSNSVKTPIHLDLKMGNLLIDCNEKALDVWLIDMDSVCLGDPLADLASFVANLYLNGLRADSTIAEIDEVVWHFIDEYKYCVTWFNQLQFIWYISAALLHEILRRSLLQQDTNRLKVNDAIIALSCRYSTLCHELIQQNNTCTAIA